MHTLKSDKLTVSFKNAGAELTGIKDHHGTEFLWHAGDPWKRHAPVLFPIVGKLKGDQYIFEGKTYQLPQHGFARDREFSLVDKSDQHAEFQLLSDAESKKVYPFDFDLRIIYSLSGAELTVQYKVKNTGSKKMYFSIGAHPAFRCPLQPDEQFTDYHIRFEKYSFLQTALRDGLRTRDTKLLPLDEKRLPLTETLFDQDALVFEDGQINEVSLVSASGRSVTLRCQDWPYFGIWSKKGCREFVCLEPWCGVADAIDSSQELTEKEGINELNPKSEFEAHFTVGIH